MTVHLGSGASDIFKTGKYPDNSIGVCQSDQGFIYWFFVGFTFDSGVQESEQQALAMAIKNFKR
jgi:hypothetical protein